MTKLIQPQLASSRPATMELQRNHIESIDLLRGIVMIIMSLDHVRATVTN